MSHVSMCEHSHNFFTKYGNQVWSSAWDLFILAKFLKNFDFSVHDSHSFFLVFGR
jgi:hypothetical protein